MELISRHTRLTIVRVHYAPAIIKQVTNKQKAFVLKPIVLQTLDLSDDL